MSITSVPNARFSNTYASTGLNQNSAEVAPGSQPSIPIQRDEFLQQVHSFSGNSAECIGYQILDPTLESNPDVSFLSAHISRFETNPEILAPRGFEVELNDRTTYDTATLGDNKAALTQYSNQLTLTDLNFGDQATIGEGFQGAEDFRNSWNRAVKEADPLNSIPGSMNWDYHHKIKGTGQAGNLVSIFESTSAYTGGAHPNHSFEVATYDAKGHRVELDDLLTCPSVPE